MKLTDNPFYILGATPRDVRVKIMKLAEEKSLQLDEGLVREATATLTNPRRRLAAEVSWLPGVGPSRITEILTRLDSDPTELLAEGRLPSLARANVLSQWSCGLHGEARINDKIIGGKVGGEGVANWIIELANAFDEVEVEGTGQVLNEERAVAGFPNISNLSHVEAELQGRRRHYRRTISEVLAGMPESAGVEAITVAVETVTDCGLEAAPVLIDDVVDEFELDKQEYLKTEAQHISALIGHTRDAAESGQDKPVIEKLIEKLETKIRAWDAVAQPIQVSARSRGQDHALSRQVASEVRGLSIDLYNDHGHLDFSKRLTALQGEVFAEIDQIVEQSEEDASALDDIAEQRARLVEEAEANTKKWKKEITYAIEYGLVKKNRLQISPEGVEWKKIKIPLEKVVRVRWGGTEHTLSTVYKIVIGDGRNLIEFELMKEKLYSEFINRLWKAVGVRLLTEMLEALRDGKSYRFGPMRIDDTGVELERRRVFKSNQRVYCKWNELLIGNGAGTFWIAKKDEQKVSAELSYQDIDNVHILESAIRVFWKKGGDKLSSLI